MARPVRFPDGSWNSKESPGHADDTSAPEISLKMTTDRHLLN